MSRCLPIYMMRASRECQEVLREFDDEDVDVIADLNQAYSITRIWLKTAKIERKPPMPKALYGRRGDDWRPLVAVADACSPEWGVRIREAMAHVARGLQDKHVLQLLLEHMRAVFDARGDNVHSEVMVADLNARDDGPWSEWRGLRDNQPPRKLTQTALAGLLRVFSPLFALHPRSVWVYVNGKRKSGKGYCRAWFEEPWKGYCDDGDTPEDAARRGVDRLALLMHAHEKMEEDE
jgi:hypothetical protein